MPKAQQNRTMFDARHYEHIAAVIRRDLVMNRELENSLSWGTNAVLAVHMADGFAIDNPNFNRERFLKACGVTPSA